jgi:hypothetical protein
MPTRLEGATNRALLNLTLGVAKGSLERDRRDREMGLSELEQQYQVQISGTAGTRWASSTVEVSFECPFYYAPGQRDSDFDRPQFWFGAETTVAVAITAVVIDWQLDDDNGAVTGATVAIGVLAGGAVPFTGFAHLTFQGFSALAEDESGEIDVG